MISEKKPEVPSAAMDVGVQFLANLSYTLVGCTLCAYVVNDDWCRL